MDQLNVVGIDSKGYGRIYKSVMWNPALHIIAKSIYAYFCAYAGNGTTAFPKRDKILCDLQINKDTYTKYLGSLVKHGCIGKYRAPTGNIYTRSFHKLINLNLKEYTMRGRGLQWKKSEQSFQSLKIEGTQAMWNTN